VIVAILGGGANRTDPVLAARWRRLGLPAERVPAAGAHSRLGATDVALGRLDVLRTLDGVEPGLLDLLLLERGGRPVLNRAAGLLAAHDKARTAVALALARLPHPRTAVLRDAGEALPLPPPLVLKPRFGSWGADVVRCGTEREARAQLRLLADRRWFRRHGVLVQELVDAPSSDLRVVVAGGTAIGAIRRTAAHGEWRTNTALGAGRTRAAPDAAAAAVACAAVRAVGLDLAGVDLLPLPSGRYIVLEVNGAVDFDETYARPGRDVFRDAARALGVDRVPHRRPAALRAAVV